MSSSLAIGAITALAFIAHQSSRTGSRSSKIETEEEKLKILLDIVLDYDGVDLDKQEGYGFVDRLKENGLELIGSGGTRFVVGLGPNLVAKIDYASDASTNTAEANTWHHYKNELDGYVVPVIGTRLNDRVLLMERATPPTTKRDKDDIARACEELPFWRELGDEAQWDFNWGLHKGRFKLLDYAIF